MQFVRVQNPLTGRQASHFVHFVAFPLFEKYFLFVVLDFALFRAGQRLCVSVCVCGPNRGPGSDSWLADWLADRHAKTIYVADPAG